MRSRRLLAVTSRIGTSQIGPHPLELKDGKTAFPKACPQPQSSTQVLIRKLRRMRPRHLRTCASHHRRTRSRPSNLDQLPRPLHRELSPQDNAPRLLSDLEGQVITLGQLRMVTSLLWPAATTIRDQTLSASPNSPKMALIQDDLTQYQCRIP